MPYLQTADRPEHWICIVHACRQPAIACCRSRHGWHAYCADHHYQRTGDAQLYTTPPGYLPPAPTPTTPRRPDIGPQPPVRPIGPTTPTPPTPDGITVPRPPVPVPVLAEF